MAEILIIEDDKTIQNLLKIALKRENHNAVAVPCAKDGIDYEYVKQLENLGEDEECCYLIPVFKDSLERVGTCSFMISEDKKIYDIAYCVHKDFWGKGYATEIAQGMIDYARSQGAEKVTIFVGQENIASNRVAQKCGGKVVSENTYKKRGTDIIMKDYKYEVVL